jgi:hypothetical protein
MTTGRATLAGVLPGRGLLAAATIAARNQFHFLECQNAHFNLLFHSLGRFVPRIIAVAQTSDN